MYFINQHNHIVQSVHMDGTGLDSSVEVFKTEEDLTNKFPEMDIDDFSYIPSIHIEENDQGTFYYLNSRIITHELVLLDYNETIEHWIENQSETFTAEDGVCF